MVCIRLTEVTVDLTGSGRPRMCTGEEMKGAILSFMTSPIFLFILLIVVFSSGTNMALETILRSRTKVSNLVVVKLRSMLASPLMSARISISFEMELCLYRDEILRPIVFPYGAVFGDEIILMDDNCRLHGTNLVNDFLLEEGIIRMKWPACFSDMN